MAELNQPREDLSREPDHVLLERMRREDECALDALIQRYWTPLVRYAVGFVRRQDEAEDIVQESFIRIWARREQWSPNGSLRSLVYTIVHNLCLHERDRVRVRADWARGEAGRSLRSPSPSEYFDEREVLRALNEAIEGLPERRREVFRLVCLHGLSYREAADVMGVAVPTVANQMSAALGELRQALHSVSDERI